MHVDSETHRTSIGTSVDLTSFSTTPPSPTDENEINSMVARNLERITELQKKLRAEEQAGLLVILLAVDTGGKDETIEEVFGVLDLRGSGVEKFGKASETEAKHDFLWRFHQVAPGKGEIVIFNRSHYDEITEPWTRGEIDEATRKMRYEHIRAFEKLLTDSDIHILKLHFRVSREEQARRVLKRLENPELQHEFSPNDIDVQRQWDTYQTAFQEILTETSAENAPWYVIPADDHPYRRFMASTLTLQALEAIGPEYPAPVEDIQQYRQELADASDGAVPSSGDAQPQ